MKITPALIKTTALWAGPLLALFIMFLPDVSPGNPAMTRMAAIALWMAVWWICEAVPLAVTALLPVVLFPILQVMPADAVSSLYFNSVIFLFIGGFLIALAMEKWNLHKRIALNIIHYVGLSPSRLILGFLIAAGFLSMWISNTATAMMMMPIAMAVILNLEEQCQEQPEVTRRIRAFSVGLLLAIAYGSSIGGIATPIGTPPNLVFMRKLEIYFPAAPEISFSGWMLFTFPITLCMLTTCWFTLVRSYCGRSKACLIADPSVFHTQRQQLGPMSPEEKAVLTIFVSTALLWMSRTDLVIGEWVLPGWSSLLQSLTGNAQWVRFMDDSTIAMAMALILFILPAHRKSSSASRLLEWPDTRQLPWGIVLLFGGGFALASGVKETGLSLWLAEQITGSTQWEPFPLMVTLSTFMTFLTEFTSNTAATEMLLPIVASIAKNLAIHPLLLMIPVTISASFAFMLPIATAPNAIIFGSNRITVFQMAKTGLILNLAGIIIVPVLMYFLGQWVFGTNSMDLPLWAR